jgi:hypothetical protein
MADYNDIKERIQQVIRPNGTGAITAADHQKLLLEMVDKIDNDFDSVEQNIKNAVSQDGKYPELTAGFATNLVGRGEAVDATINFRPSGGTSIEDGAARVKELKGNSVVWNQIIDHIANTQTYKGITYTKGQGYYTIVGSVESGSTQSYLFISSPFRQMKGHKYFIFNDSKNEGVKVGAYAEGGLPIVSVPTIVEATTDTTSQKIAIEVRGSGINETIHPYFVDLTQMFGEGNEPTSVEEFYNRIPQNVDLYAYNEGEVISTNAEGIKSVGFNAWDEEWERGYWDELNKGVSGVGDQIRCKNFIKVLPSTQYRFSVLSDIKSNVVLYFDNGKNLIQSDVVSNSIFTTPTNCQFIKFYMSGNYGKTYNHDICINLSHTGYRNGEYQPYMQFIRDIDPRIKEAFPNGMRSAGTASDKVYNKNGKGYIEKHIGSVDLGSLEWINRGTFFLSENLSELAATHWGLVYIPNVVCGQYRANKWDYISTEYDDKTCSAYENQVRVADSAYTDVASFKAAMSGVMLYYELAEPIITEYDEPFNLDYEVWDFGTEQMLSTKPSAPIKASIVYGFNAVDSVRTAQLEIAELKTQIAQMQAIMASMTAQSAALTE